MVRPSVGSKLSRDVLARAEGIVSQYRLLLEPSDGGGYLGYSIELRGVMADGRTPEECARATLVAQVGMVAAMLEAGDRPPPPSTDGKRDNQINIRVTIEEKLLLESAAKRQGFRGISEFLRNAGLRAADSE